VGRSSRAGARDDGYETVLGRFAGILGIALAGLAVWLANARNEATVVAFEPYDPVAVTQARAARKPVVIYVSSCAERACREQNRGALRDPQVMAALEPFARFKIEASRNRAAADQVLIEMNMPVLPVFIFTSPAGAKVTLTGLQSSAALLAAAAKAAKP
jgi:thiol:disulfide interchange protein